MWMLLAWLAAQNQATAHQMCSAVCVLPWLCTQPITYHNCIAWGGLWEAERKARAQLTFFLFTVCFISSHSSFSSSYTLVLHTDEKILGSDPSSYFWLLGLVLAAQPTLSNLPELHGAVGFALSAFKGTFKKDSENKTYTHTHTCAHVSRYRWRHIQSLSPHTLNKVKETVFCQVSQIFCPFQLLWATPVKRKKNNKGRCWMMK